MKYNKIMKGKLSMQKKFEEKLVLEVLEQNGVYVDEDYKDDILEMDSLTFMSVIVGLEESFQINIPAQYINKINGTYNDFLKYVEKILNDPDTKEKQSNYLSLD